MPRKDYYVILGIPRNESAAGIRAAYRDLAKRHHPDVAGEAGAGAFREIAEAYQVLNDPNRRRRYNDWLASGERPRPETALWRSSEEAAARPPSIFERPESVFPSLDELMDRYLRNFTGAGVPKGEHEEGLNLEVVLTPEEALAGGSLPVRLPVFEECPACGGTGSNWLFPCLRCRTQGWIEISEVVRVRIPPGIRTGTVIELPLRGLGIHNFFLRVHILVG